MAPVDLVRKASSIISNVAKTPFLMEQLRWIIHVDDAFALYSYEGSYRGVKPLNFEEDYTRLWGVKIIESRYVPENHIILQIAIEVRDMTNGPKRNNSDNNAE